MRSKGAVVVDPVDIPTYNALASDSSVVLQYEFKQNLNDYLATVPNSPLKTLDALVEFNRRQRSTAIPYGQELLINSNVRSGTAITAEEAAADRKQDLALARGGLDRALDQNHLDALLFPESSSASIGAKAGYPTLVVPAGYRSDGSPVGVSFLGKAFSEPLLIEIAYAYEQAAKLRRPPSSTP